MTGKAEKRAKMRKSQKTRKTELLNNENGVKCYSLTHN